MTNENEVKPKKKTPKWIWIIGGIFLLIVIIAITGNGEEEVQIQKFSFEEYIQEELIKEYKIIEEEDLSIKALGGRKLSEVSSEEIERAPLNFRMRYTIIVPRDITLEELKTTFAQVIKEKSTANPDIDAIHVEAWESEEAFKGGTRNIGYAQWAPDGNWGNMTPEIARNNVRDTYKITYDISEMTLEAIREREEEVIFGLKEATRKEIFKKIIRCEDEANNKAKRYYFPGCEACPEFIVADVLKYADKLDELMDNCKKEIRKKHGTTEEIELKIVVEAFKERWLKPEPLPMPDCCR